MKKTKKILIANRGVIAIRALRAARELGYEVSSVYSTVDKDQKHLKLSDDAICIGPASVKDSYLNEAAIISAAELSNCDAIYPGFGFLAENANFAEKCEKSGFKFVGPDVGVIASMGDKIKAKEIMQELNVPTVPGYDGDITTEEQIQDKVEKILSRIACHGSIRSGRRMRGEEMNALLREMESTPHSGQCNHGRPTYVELKLSDIERLFGRR